MQHSDELVARAGVAFDGADEQLRDAVVDQPGDDVDVLGLIGVHAELLSELGQFGARLGGFHANATEGRGQRSGLPRPTRRVTALARLPAVRREPGRTPSVRRLLGCGSRRLLGDGLSVVALVCHIRSSR